MQLGSVVMTTCVQSTGDGLGYYLAFCTATRVDTRGVLRGAMFAAAVGSLTVAVAFNRIPRTLTVHRAAPRLP